jgi:hypothetical protein
MTKREALKHFRWWLRGMILAKGSIATDLPAQREAWNNYTDRLCKNGDITLRQYENWTHPIK